MGRILRWGIGGIVVVIGSLAGRSGPAPRPLKVPVPTRAIAPPVRLPAPSAKRAPLINLAPAAQAYQQERRRQEQQERIRQQPLPGF